MASLQFRRQGRPRNYLARREQWRLLLIVLALGLVALLYSQSRNPENFRWFDALRQVPAEAERAAPPRPAAPPASQDLPGMFRAPLADKPGVPAEESKKQASSVRADYLSAVRDDTPFRSAEQKAWFHLLEILKETPAAALRQSSIGRVTYVQLAQQPEAYRGELVTLAGTVRRAQRVTAPKNDRGIESYYQLWLQPEDDPTDPIVVYSLELPEGFPTGMEVSADARLTGFFFKRWAYMAQDRLRSAPTVLSRTVDWRKRTETVAPRRDGDPSIWLVLGVSAGLAALGVVYVYLRTKGEKRPQAEKIVVPDLSRQYSDAAVSEQSRS